MWLCFSDAFLSVVADPSDLSCLLVRARRREHLTRLFGPQADIKVNVGTDYKYRVFVDRTVMADLVAQSIQNIDYGNFKASVRDPALENLYHHFWHQHAAMQK
jgi:hypothetical protein